MPRPTSLSLLSTLVLGLLTPKSAEAAASLSGTWKASGLGSKWVEGKWSPSCGAKPGSGGGSGTVTITQSGSELTISGGGRTFSTRECWTTESGMTVANHTGGVRNWKTTCKTPPGASRKVTTTTTLTATDDTITFYETGQYQFSVGSEHCTASVGRYRTYTLIERAGGPAGESHTGDPVAKAPAADKSATRCAEPGPVRRIEITPGHRLMSPGDEYVFKAVAFDDKGCRVKKRPRWSIEGASGTVEVGPDGKVAVRSDAPEGEIDLRASFGSKSDAARIEVASKERLEALLARGVDEGPTPEGSAEPAIASQSLGAEAAVAEDRASGRKLIFVGLVSLVALGLGAAGLFLARRSRSQSRSGRDAAHHASRADSRPSSGRARAPSSGPPSSGAPSSGPPSTAMAPGGAPPTMGSGAPWGSAPPPTAPSSGGTPWGGTSSPGPASPGAPWGSAPPPTAASPTGSETELKKLCPVCGRQYPAASQFCGQDGANLVPMN